MSGLLMKGNLLFEGREGGTAENGSLMVHTSAGIDKRSKRFAIRKGQLLLRFVKHIWHLLARSSNLLGLIQSCSLVSDDGVCS